MKQQVTFSKDNVSARKGILEQAAYQLKNEFIGIDRVIDRLTETISSWYVFPGMQDRPVVVNLWGMTGVGKTSLVKRLAQLLGFEQKFYHFDLGVNSDNASSIKSHLKSLFRHANGEPAIIALDEFQHARTLDERGAEIDKYYSRIIWELLDSGRFQSTRTLDIESLYRLLERVKFFVDHGVRVEKGKVTGNAAFFMDMMDLNDGSDYDDWEPPDFISSGSRERRKRPPAFLPRNISAKLYSMSDEMFKNVYELNLHLLSLDGPGILRFLEEILAYANSRKEVDCSKALILVMGNLDEAYTMSRNFNPDINADEFYELSLQIKLPDIKDALRCRFRNEQIARLGNNHIIYPAFSSKAYEQLILLELNKLSLKVKDKFGWALTFTESMRALIYREGVFPTQGSRPLFSTIQQLIHSRITRIAYEAVIGNLDADTVRFSFVKQTMVVEYFKGNKKVHAFKEKPELNLEKLRRPKQGDAQALTAVHESGHAILSMLLMKIVPECIFSMTIDGEAAGYVLTRSPCKYLSREGITKQIAVYLGGLIAEEIVFGRENITTGSEDDLIKATSLAAAAIKEYGMGRLMASIQVKDYRRNKSIHDTGDEHNRLAEQWVKEARQLAERCLKENETWLLRMADYLSDRRVMQKEDILRFARLFSDLRADHFIRDPDHVFYRGHLKEKVAAIDKKPATVKADRSMLLALNKEQAKLPDSERG